MTLGDTVGGLRRRITLFGPNNEPLSFLDLPNVNAAAVAVVDAAGNQITSFGTTIPNPLPISASALPLPSGASTETTLAALKTDLELLTALILTTGGQTGLKAMIVGDGDKGLMNIAGAQINPATEDGNLASILTRLNLLLADATFTGRIGEVQASPTANTVLDRLKAIATALSAVTVQQSTPANLKAQVSVASGGIVDGGDVTLGAKADARSTATDATAITAMQVLKQISYMLQNPANCPVADGGDVTQGAKADNRSAATDTTAVSAISILKELSYLLQNRLVAQASRQTFTPTPVAFTSTTSVGTLLAADGTYGLDLCSIIVENISATATEVIIYADNGTSEVARIYCPSGDTRGISFPAGRELTQGAVNKAWKAKTVTSVASVYITPQYIKNTAWAI